MIRTLDLQGYRGFKSFGLSDLKRVNLLVGKNNCGKTSILEAIDFLVSRGNPTVLSRSAHRRGEIGPLRAKRQSSSHSQEMLPDVSNLFFGHQLKQGATFRISSDDDIGMLLIELRSLSEVEHELGLRGLGGTRQTSFFADDLDPEPALGFRITSNVPDWFHVSPVAYDGLLYVSRSIRSGSSSSGQVPEVPPVEFLAPDSLQLDSMRDTWDKVLAEGRESEVIDAMQLLESDLDSIHFLTGDAYRRTSGGVLLGSRKSRRRVPLGSYGDGMRRLLALSVSLVQTANGILLIDEIDTGLHFSVMEEMWNLVVSTARQSNVQVFATTHSYDCIEGLAALVESSPGLGSELAVQKIEPSLAEAVSLDADQIRVAVRQDIEVR